MEKITMVKNENSISVKLNNDTDTNTDNEEGTALKINFEYELNRKYIYDEEEDEIIGETNFIVPADWLNSLYLNGLPNSYTSFDEFLEVYVPEEDGEYIYQKALEDKVIIKDMSDETRTIPVPISYIQTFKNIRFTYSFKFATAEEIVYSRTKSYDHILSENEIEKALDIYELQLSTKAGVSFVDRTCIFVGRKTTNPNYTTNSKVIEVLSFDKISEKMLGQDWCDGDWWIEFDYEIDNHIIHEKTSIAELHYDWWNNAEYCPSNDTICWNVHIYNKLTEEELYLSNNCVHQKNVFFADIVCTLGHAMGLETFGF